MPTSPASAQRRAFLSSLAGAGLMAAAPLAASAAPAQPAAPFVPKLGQHGKDVIWLPTPEPLIKRLLTMAGLGPRDTLVDLGSGDGAIVISAARDFGAKAHGVEYDARMVELSRHNAAQEKVSDKTSFEQGDLYATDFSRFDVVAMYLLPQMNVQLRHKLMAMKPGTRIVTHQFHLGAWEPDETTLISYRPGYLWIVPARAAGRWALTIEGEPDTIELSLEQSFQRLEGHATLQALQTTLRSPRLLGKQIHFAYTDQSGFLREFSGWINGEQIHGSVSGPRGNVPFTARLLEAATVAGTEPATEDEINAAIVSLGGH